MKSTCNGVADRACGASGCRIPRECIDAAIAKAEQQRAHAIGDWIAERLPSTILAVGLLALALVVMFG